MEEGDDQPKAPLSNFREKCILVPCDGCGMNFSRGISSDSLL